MKWRKKIQWRIRVHKAHTKNEWEWTAKRLERNQQRRTRGSTEEIPLPCPLEQTKSLISGYMLSQRCTLNGNNYYLALLKYCKKPPKWLLKGDISLMETYSTKNPKNYRQITCPSNICKTLTSILTEKTYTFKETNETFPLEQKGFKRESYGRSIVNKQNDNKTLLLQTWHSTEILQKNFW